MYNGTFYLESQHFFSIRTVRPTYLTRPAVSNDGSKQINFRFCLRPGEIIDVTRPCTRNNGKL